MMTTFLNLKHLAVRALLLALGLGAVTAASAETLMMPNRDARKNVSVVVWGVTTQPNGTSFTLDYGDGTAPTVGTVADRSYIAFNHTYAATDSIPATPATDPFTATLTVGSGAGAEVASVVVKVFDPASFPDGGAAGANNRSLGINMAIEDGLRYLWLNQNLRDLNFPGGSNTSWGQYLNNSVTALTVLAFENHGYGLTNNNAAPTGLYQKYVVQRGLNYIVGGLQSISLTAQPAGSPCSAGLGVAANDCSGLHVNEDNFHGAYQTAIAVLPLAASGALGRTAINGKTYGETLQRVTNALVWGQIDSGSGRGGWYYYLSNNGSEIGDGSTVGWGYLALLDAAAAGATVPQFAKDELVHSVNGHLNTDGSFDYQSDANPNQDLYVNMEKAGIGLQGLFVAPSLQTPSKITAVRNYITDRWNSSTRLGPDYIYWNCGTLNKGCGYSMFNNFKGLKLMGISQLPGIGRPAGPGGIPQDDWYADYQDWLVLNQSSPNTVGGGNWNAMDFSCCESDTSLLNAAIAELILSPVALVLPDADKFSTVGLKPATNTALEGGSHTVTAKAESGGGDPGTGTPVAGATVIFTILSGPNAGKTGQDTTDSNGEATFTYTDDGPEGTVGTDKIQASIGNLDSNIVDMTWTPLNRPPVATNNGYTMAEDGLLSGNAVVDGTPDSDPDEGDTLTASLVAGVSNGVLALLGDGSFTYSPKGNYCGPDSFTYTVNDGTVDSNIATVAIDVTCVNDPPVAFPDAKVINEDSFATGAVTSTDVDGGPPVYSGPTSGPSNGVAVVNADGTYTYTPAPNFNGGDSFTYTVVDGNGGSATSTVTITVLPVNDAPFAVDDAYSGQWNTLLTVPVNGVLGNDGDIDGDVLTSIKLTNPVSGAIVLNANGSLTYMPAANFAGVATFTYKANDGSLDSNDATVRITIISPCPSKSRDHKSRDGKSHDGNSDDGKSRDGRSNDRHHSFGGDRGSDDRSHDDKSSDDRSNDGRCRPGTPISHSDHYTTKKGKTLTVAAKDGVLDNDSKLAKTAELILGANHGTVVLASNGSFVYTPTPGFQGNDAFYYVARSAAGVAGKVVKVSIRVRGHWDGDGCDHDKKKNKHKKGDKCDHDKDHD